MMAANHLSRITLALALISSYAFDQMAATDLAPRMKSFKLHLLAAVAD
jgi:hypothetical protein